MKSERGKKFLLVVAGPTAVGKTSLCIQLSLHFKSKIISADSRQFFKEMKIGTAKPTEAELNAVEHYFVNNLSINQEYDVRQYEIDALQLIENIFEKESIVILTGGSGMYIKAVIEGFDDMPASDPQVRETLNQLFASEGIEALQKRLFDVDPEYFSVVDTNNPQRIIRALEVFLISGKPFSSFRMGATAKRDFNIIKIGLERDRKELYERIDERMDEMIENGLFEEAKKLYPYKHHNALQTVGYKEIFDFIDGKYDREEAIRLLKRNSRRYAKRQMTWFKKDADYVWFHPDSITDIIKYVNSNL